MNYNAKLSYVKALSESVRLALEDKKKNLEKDMYERFKGIHADITAGLEEKTFDELITVEVELKNMLFLIDALSSMGSNPDKGKEKKK